MININIEYDTDFASMTIVLKLPRKLNENDILKDKLKNTTNELINTKKELNNIKKETSNNKHKIIGLQNSLENLTNIINKIA